MKKRIEELKKEDDWKKKIVERWNEEAKSEAKEAKAREEDDNRSQASEAHSVASERTQSKILPLSK